MKAEKIPHSPTTLKAHHNTHIKGEAGRVFSELYERHWSKVFHFASLYLKNKEEIRDVVQEIFLKLWESGKIFDDYKSIENYLFIVTRNHVFNLKRHKSFNEDFFELTLQSAIDQPYDITNEVETENIRQLLDTLIEAMPPQRQRVFNLSRKECMTNRQVAEKLDISETMVEKHIHLALRYLRDNMKFFSIFISL